MKTKETNLQKEKRLRAKAKIDHEQQISRMIDTINSLNKNLRDKDKPKERKYIITIGAQNQTITGDQKAKDRVKQLLDANIWWIQLTTIEAKNE